MRLGKLLTYFDTSPALRLLRSNNAAFIIDFLDRQFKQSGRITILQSDLMTALSAYQDELQESYPGRLPTKADIYLTEWCSRDSRWLKRFMAGGCNEPVYQLTPHTEDVFVFLDRVLDKDLGFVGTESRLKLVIDTLSDLVVGSSDDPETRIRHLSEERDRIQAEMDQIQADGCVSKYQPAQVRERFATAVSLLRQLQGDFRAVEESFRDITVQVQQRQVGGETRGKILEFALDAEELLKQEDQGVSFYEFVRLVLSPSQTERLERIIRDVRRIPDLHQQSESMESVRGMVNLLQNEAEKVMRTNQRLSATLRRLLDARGHAERQRITESLRNIRAKAVALAGDDGTDDIGISLEVDLIINSPFRRTFWSEPSRFEAITLTGFTPDANERLAAFRQFAALQRLDWAEMRERIKRILAVEHAPTLRDLLELHPPEGGVVEVIGYVQIAAEDGHLIDSVAREVVVVSTKGEDNGTVALDIPRVSFIPNRRNGHAR